jgi:hypothetical protein
MTDDTAYTPPKVWTWNKENGGQFANINRPMAGPTHDKDLPVGCHPMQLDVLDKRLAESEYKNVQRWTDAIAKRPAVKRGRMVNRIQGDPASQLRERHEASDFDTKTQDKVIPSA